MAIGGILTRNVSVDPKAVARIVFDKLMPACDKEPFEESVMSLLTLACLMMRPSMSTEELQEAVLNTSQYLVMQISPNMAEGN